MPSVAKKSETLIYHVAFEDYLQPKKHFGLTKQTKLQFSNQESRKKRKPEMRLKLLEHPVLVAGRPSKYQQCKRWLKEKLNKYKSKNKIVKVAPASTVNAENLSDAKLLIIGRKWQLQTKRFKTQLKSTKSRDFFKLPSFLAFLRARNDDGLCKRKSGFEIYCEMSSIHGFINFVGAKTWQRVFWCLVIAVAMIMSAIFLSMWHIMNVDTPVIMTTESTHHPAWTIPFPAITICNLNRVSRRKSAELMEKFLPHSNLSRQEMLRLFVLPLYSVVELKSYSAQDFLLLQQLLEHNNYTLTQFQREISPDCSNEIVRCKWKGRNRRCDKLFRHVETPQGYCCAFNYHGWTREELKSQDQHQISHHPYQITSCGYKTGLTLLLDPHIDDYMASASLTPGYQLLIYDSHDYPADSVERQYIWLRSETSVRITPQQTTATSYMSSLKPDIRGCYLPGERKLKYFKNYTQTNCLAECRSEKMAAKCGCVPTHWPRENDTIECSLEKATCVLKNKAIHYALLTHKPHGHSNDDNNAEHFICDCYPECSFNKYSSSLDSAKLNRTFAMGDRRFFKDIVIENHIILHVFYGDLIAMKFRLDVYENWLSFVGTFGGIAGLHMGYSFVSGFEMIFFSLVRPLCNWLTRKQIYYRVKRKQQKAAAVAAAKKALDEKRLASERAANDSTNVASSDVKV